MTLSFGFLYQDLNIKSIVCVIHMSTFQNIFVSGMQPKTDKPSASSYTLVSLPTVQLTPSEGHAGSDCLPAISPWLLRPNHEIPSTPPPQNDPKPPEFLTKRFG